MDSEISPLLLFRLVFKPSAAFESLARNRPHATHVFFKLSLWLLALPPVFAYIGTMNFGWQLGAAEPLILPSAVMIRISVAYFFLLLFGFLSTAAVARWMSWTYEARHSMGIHFALITVVGSPLIVGSAAHLYPHAFINALILVPTVIWSMYLLYRGLPIVLKISPERGMLMASALIGYLLVAFVSLLGITVVLWGYGIGPNVGI